MAAVFPRCRAALAAIVLTASAAAVPALSADSIPGPKLDEVMTVRSGPPGLTAWEETKARLSDPSPSTPERDSAPPRTPPAPRVGCAIYILFDGDGAPVTIDPGYFDYYQTSYYWAAVGLRSSEGADWDLELYDEATGGADCVTGLLASSQYTSGYTDFVVTDYNHSPVGFELPKAYRYSGTAGAWIEWDDGPDILATNQIAEVLTDSTDVLEIWDVYLSAGTLYDFEVSSVGGVPGPEISLFLFENPGSGPYYAGRNSASLAISPPDHTGQFLPTRSDWYGLVAVNENGEAGRYWVSHGHCTPPETLIPGLVTGNGQGYEWFTGTQTDGYWMGFGMRTDSNSLGYNRYGSASGLGWPHCFGDWASGHGTTGPGRVVFTLGDYNRMALGPFYFRTAVNRGHDLDVQWDAGTDLVRPMDPPVYRTTDADHVIEVWDVELSESQTYNVSFQTTGAADLELFLIPPIGGVDWYDDTNDIHATSGSCEPVGAWDTDYYGVAVVNHNGETGTYQFEFDYPVVDVTPSPLSDPMSGRGVAWVDVDVDGDDDLFVCQILGSSRLFRNDGGVFVDATPPALEEVGVATGSRWADFDNDGDPDVLIDAVNAPFHHPMLYENEGMPLFTDVTPSTFPEVGAETPVVASWVDFDRDGNLDVAMILWNSADMMRIYRGDGEGGFVEVADAPADAQDLPYGIVWSDFDGDLDADFYVSTAHLNRLFRNEGGVALTDVTSTFFPLATGVDSWGAVWADLDSDLDPDLYVSNSSPARDVLWRNDGDVFVFVSHQLPYPLASYHAVNCVDIDNDGSMDIHVAPFDSTGHHFLVGSGGGYFAPSENPVWDIREYPGGMAYADVDGDGDLDGFVASADGTASHTGHLLRNDLCPGNHWLEVDLVGTVSNRSALGARVTVHADWLTVRRELTPDMPHWCQNSPTLHFGLGYKSPVDSVIVDWPSGIRQVVEAPIDSRITIVESGPGVGAPVDDGAVLRLALHPAAPNPVSGTARIRYDLPASADASVRIYDVAGRRVRTLVQRSDHPAGRHQVLWNGTDEGGDRVTSGVYFLRLESGDRCVTKRVVLVR